MSQHDLVIANQLTPDFRSDLNDALQALGSLSAGSSEPTTTYANMLWYDSGNNILKMRTEADDAWIDIGTLNQSTNTFEVSNLTELTQTQAEDDTSADFGTVSGQRLSQAVESSLNVTGSAPMYACRAWVNFDGTGTVSIRASGNVSSITDNGTGDYTVNFATDMPDSNYSVATSSDNDGNTGEVGNLGQFVGGSINKSSVGLRNQNFGSNNKDANYCHVAIFR